MVVLDVGSLTVRLGGALRGASVVCSVYVTGTGQKADCLVPHFCHLPHVVSPVIARQCAVCVCMFAVFTLLGLGKKQTVWYPTFVTYPMW